MQILNCTSQALACSRTDGVLVDDSPDHLVLEVVQELGPARCLRIAVWPLPGGE